MNAVETFLRAGLENWLEFRTAENRQKAERLFTAAVREVARKEIAESWRKAAEHPQKGGIVVTFEDCLAEADRLGQPHLTPAEGADADWAASARSAREKWATENPFDDATANKPAEPKWEPKEGEYYIDGTSKRFICRKRHDYEFWDSGSSVWGKYPNHTNARPLAPNERIVEGDDGETVIRTVTWSSDHGQDARLKKHGWVYCDEPGGEDCGRLGWYLLYHWGQPDAYKPEDTK